MNNEHKLLRPCLVLGTGFHHWVLGASMRKDFQPLLDWNALLLAVARELRLPLDKTIHSLSLHWERLLDLSLDIRSHERAPEESVRKATISALELSAKRVTARLLLDNQAAYPAGSQRARFPLDDVWGAVVSLNFDAHWLGAAKLRWAEASKHSSLMTPVSSAGRALSVELATLNRHVLLVKSSNGDGIRHLWFPDGYIEQPRSLRLGLREFGFQPVAIYEAFNALKSFERRAGAFEHREGFVRKVLEGSTNSSPLDFVGPLLPLTWVTEMMYRPVCFAGVGMSEAEGGLWWLMVQRARNLANVCPKRRPPAAILVMHDDPRLPFWRTKPCNIEPIVCSNWDDGWMQVKAWADVCTQKSLA